MRKKVFFKRRYTQKDGAYNGKSIFLNFFSFHSFVPSSLPGHANPFNRLEKSRVLQEVEVFFFFSTSLSCSLLHTPFLFPTPSPPSPTGYLNSSAGSCFPWDAHQSQALWTHPDENSIPSLSSECTSLMFPLFYLDHHPEIMLLFSPKTIRGRPLAQLRPLKRSSPWPSSFRTKMWVICCLFSLFFFSFLPRISFMSTLLLAPLHHPT